LNVEFGMGKLCAKGVGLTERDKSVL
jgi:hypothetical protein